MLAEAFIRVKAYQEGCYGTATVTVHPHAHSHHRQSSRRELWKEDSTFIELGEEMQEETKPARGSRQPALPQSSEARPIQGREPQEHMGLELYRSWGCTSICKDYPDLQIGGDHIGDRSSAHSGLYVAQMDSKTHLGPVLQSGDLDLGLEALQPGPQLQGWGEQGKAGRLCEAGGLGESGSDDGYLVMDSSISLHREPLSNSMLNSYLENKLLEVYKQYLQDSLVKCGSPSRALPTSFIQDNVQQLSQQLSQEQGLDVPRARSIVINYLSGLHGSCGSHFSSPVLRISNAEQRKFLEPPKRKASPTTTTAATPAVAPAL
ncbi:TLR adapter interacting with SLC15A4 on the lysosome [Amia ocellicauda]|uniref:TLR adapter interacting with SLC15A4 on the lysosome n=1 Tax=Amia ocellicauda TaxID=2972642 RepID=UPI003464A813